jgi:hypothetical protein
MVIGSFGGGYYVKGKFDKANEIKEYAKLVQTIQQNDLQARKTITEYQQIIATKDNTYQRLTKELKHVKIYTSKCNITADGIKLWDDSSKGLFSPVPKDSARITEATSTPSTITIDDVFENKLKNDEICNGFRQQIEAIIKWDKEAWHDTNSAGNN